MTIMSLENNLLTDIFTIVASSRQMFLFSD